MLKFAILFLVAEGVGVLAWWVMLLLYPATRAPFVASGAPETTLLAFMVPDILLYAGAALLAGYGLARGRSWGWPVLCVHGGAAAYAALYGLSLPLLGGGVWLGALLMSPSLLVLPFLIWCLRPETSYENN